ncbi:MAG: hypothetical protein AB7N65_21130, partial [Vicinamibacterales bacterium]
YNVSAQVDPAIYAAARWVSDPTQVLPSLMGANTLAVDRQVRRVILFTSEWEVQYFERQHPDVALQAESTQA